MSVEARSNHESRGPDGGYSRPQPEQPSRRALSIAALMSVLFLALLPQFSIRLGNIVTGWGESPELDPFVAWRHLAPTWSWSAGLGFDGSTARPILFPFVIVAMALRSVGLSAEAVCRLWYAALFVLQGWGTATLAGVVLRGRISRDQLLIIQFFAVVNPLELITLRSAYLTTALSFATFPALLATAVHYVRSRSIARFVGFVILAAVAATGDANVAVFAAELVVLAGVALLWFRARYFQPVALLAAAFFSVNVIWIVPAIFGLLHTIPLLGPATDDYTEATLRRVAEFSAWPHSARLVGGYLFFNSLAGGPYLPEGASYDHNLFVLASSCVVPLLALAGFIAGLVAGDRDIVKVGLIGGFALFVAKGSSAPFGDIFAFLSRHTFVFRGFRDSFAKLEWIVLLAYAILMARCFAATNRLLRPMRLALLWTTTVAIAVAGYPILIGNLFWPHISVAIPQRYRALAAKLNSEGDKSVVAEIPMAPYVFDAYRWGYVGPGLNAQLLERPVLTGANRSPSPINELLGSVLEDIPHIDIQTFGQWLGLRGIGGLLVDDSADPSIHVPVKSSAPLAAFLPHARIAWRGGSIRFYSIDSALVNPRLYMARNVMIGTYNEDEKGQTCRALKGCRASAFIASNNASVGLKGDRAFVIRQPVFRTTVLSAAPRESSLRTFVDDVDRVTDITGRTFATRFRTVFSTDVAILRIGPSVWDKDADAMVNGAITIGSPTRLCRSANKVAELDLSPLTHSGTGVLALTYSSDRNAAAKLLTYSKRGNSITWLPDRSARASIARILPIDASVRARLLLEARPKPACLTIQYFAFARFLPRSAYARVKSVLHGTVTPYRWLAEDPLTRFNASSSPKLTKSCAGDCKVSLAEARRSTTLSMRLIASEPSAGACSHAHSAEFRADNFRLIPGLQYSIHLTLSTSAAARAKVALVSDDRFQIAEAVYKLGRGTSLIDLPFVAPSGIADAIILTGLEFSSRDETACVLAGSLVQKVPPAAFVVRLAHLAPVRWREDSTNNSATRYALTLQLHEAEPQLIILNQTFDDRWIIDTRSPVSAEHVLVNGGVNGWIVRGNGDVRVELRYAGAALAAQCLIVGLAGLAATIILAFAFWQNGRRQNRKAVLSR